MKYVAKYISFPVIIPRNVEFLNTVRTDRAKIFIPCKRVENNHVINNESQPGLKMEDCARKFELEKQIDECLSKIMSLN